jgi:putative NADH-flavin reductase
MKLTLFGATGRTGRHLLQKALDEGHQVTVLVRNPAKLDIKNERLTVIQGSLTDESSVEQAVKGTEVVLSALGPANNRPTFEISQGMQTILRVMHKNGVKRLIISAGAGVGDPEDAPKLFNKLMNVLLKAASRYVYEDMLKTVDLVRASGLDWTIVRVPMLTDEPATGQVKVGMVGKGMGARISRADMADFMLEQVKNSDYVRKAPAISN